MIGSKVISWLLAMVLLLLFAPATLAQLHVQLEVYEVSTTIGDCDGLLAGDSDPAWRWTGADIINQCYQTTCNGCTRSVSEIIYDQTFSCLSEIPNNIDVTFKGCENDGAACVGGTFTGICDGTSAEVTTTLSLPTSAGTTNLPAVSGTSTGCVGTWTYKARWVVTGSTTPIESSNGVCFATEIFPNASSLISNNICSNTQTNEPSSQDPNISPDHTNWHYFIASSPNIRVSTDNSGTNFDTELTVYRLDKSPICVFRLVLFSRLTEYGSNDDVLNGQNNRSQVDLLCVTPGDTFYIQVDGNDANDQGQYELSVEDISPFYQQSVAECDSFVWSANGLTYLQSGVYTDTLSAIRGCDSIVQIDLTINQSSHYNEVLTACGSFNWTATGATLYQSGNYLANLQTSNGCDSVVNLDLTIFPVSIRIDSIESCDSYTWQQNGETYHRSGTYFDTMASITLCDSIVGLSFDRRVLKNTYNLTGVGADEDALGFSVAMDGDYAISGAPGDDEKGIQSGAAFIYKKDSSGVWKQETKIMASDGFLGEQFGYSVAIEGNLAMVGAPFAIDNTTISGAVYFFEKTTSGHWIEIDKVTPNDGADNDEFGFSVGMHLSRAIVGAPSDDDNGWNSGSIYFLHQTASGQWSQSQKRTASDGSSGHLFGHSVSLHGNWAVAGSPDDDANGPRVGAAYAFEQNSLGTWTETQKLVSNNVDNWDNFGYSVALEGNRFVVGAPGIQSGAVLTGGAFVFERGGNGVWTEMDDLSPLNWTRGYPLGGYVDIDGNRAVVGPMREISWWQYSPGRAHIFEYGLAGVWTESASIQSVDGKAGDHFGKSVAVDGLDVIIGSSMSDDAGDNSGSIYFFESFNFGPWQETVKVTANDISAGDALGSSVALKSEFAASGSPNDDKYGSNSGSVTLFLRDSTGEWVNDEKLYDTTGVSGDNFGSSLALSEDRILVGAPGDDSNGSNSGAVHVFRRSNETWVKGSKITASDGAASDRFGSALAVDGSLAVIGAFGDDVNGSFSGSAYIFFNPLVGWIEMAKLTASDGAFHDNFGYSVDIDSSIVVVGAPDDDDNGFSSGSAYVFEQNSQSQWNEVSKLSASDGSSVDFFGQSVSVFKNTIAIGAPTHDGLGNNAGAVYIFSRDTSGQWLEVAKLEASDGQAEDRFGTSIDLNAQHIVIGASGNEVNGQHSGSVYLFKRTAIGQWHEVSKLTPVSIPDSSDFGAFVAIDGVNVMVGAPNNKSNGEASGSVHLYSLLSSFKDTMEVANCMSYTWPLNGQTYIQSGVYTESFSPMNSCDSSYTLRLTLHPTYSDTLEVNACNDYTWPTTAHTYLQSGVYVDSAQSSLSCDSLQYLNLTINNADGLEAGTIGTYRVVIRWRSTGSNNYVVRIKESEETSWQSFLTTDTVRALQNRAPGDYAYYIKDLNSGDSSCVDNFTIQCATDITYTFNAFQAPELGRLGRVRVFGTQGGKRLYDIHLVDENGDSSSALNVRQRNYTDLTSGDYSLYVRDDFGCEAAAVGQFTINAMDTSFIPNLINAPNNPPNGFRPTWNSVDGVINYQLRVVNVTDGTLQLFQTGINDTSYAVTNLPTGKLYRFNVRSRYNNGVANVNSAYSNPTSRNLLAGGNKGVEQGELAAEGVFGQINIYPNPTSDLLYVQAPEGSALTLIDMNGKAIMQRTAKATEEVFDLSELAQGVYLLGVNNDGQLYHERIVKQ